MKKLILILVVFLSVLCSYPAGACDKKESLFKIERSKNRNIVQYDACLISDGDLSKSSPIDVYWVLENGHREDLSALERDFVYGIRIGQDPPNGGTEIFLPALRKRKAVVEKIYGKYRVVVSINGKESILKKIYVKSEERLSAFPSVLYIELFGRTLGTNLPARERIIP